jgi:hypothetical protein
MYGPRSAYDSQTLAVWDEQNKQADFRRQLIEALKHPDVQAAIRDLLPQVEANHASD